MSMKSLKNLQKDYIFNSVKALESGFLGIS